MDDTTTNPTPVVPAADQNQIPAAPQGDQIPGAMPTPSTPEPVTPEAPTIPAEPTTPASMPETPTEAPAAPAEQTGTPDQSSTGGQI